MTYLISDPSDPHYSLVNAAAISADGNTVVGAAYTAAGATVPLGKHTRLGGSITVSAFSSTTPAMQGDISLTAGL